MDYRNDEHWEELHTHSPRYSSRADAALIDSMLVSAERLHGRLEGARVLDFSCGAGTLSKVLSRRGARVVALDRSRGALMLASRGVARRVGQAGPIADEPAAAEPSASDATEPLWIQCDARSPALARRAFDLVFCLRSIWALPDLPTVLAGISQAMVPGGWLLVQTWGEQRKSHLLSLGCAVLGHHLPQLRVPADRPGPFDFGPKALFPLLHAAGFVELETQDHGAEFRVHSTDEYWCEFSALAGTAHLEWSRQPPAMKARIDQQLSLLLHKCAWSAQAPTLPLEWQVVCARATTVLP